MATRPLRIWGDPVLRSVARPVESFDRALRTLVEDLTDTLNAQEGAGLAAPQLGVDLRVFVFQVGGVAGHLINPTLDFPDDQEQDGPEGCLSIPGLYYDTRRRLNVVAAGVDQHGEPVQVVGTERLARCLQHETDHLDGVLFIDRLDRETRRQALREIRETDWGSMPARPQVRLSPHAPGPVIR